DEQRWETASHSVVVSLRVLRNCEFTPRETSFNGSDARNLINTSNAQESGDALVASGENNTVKERVENDSSIARQQQTTTATTTITRSYDFPLSLPPVAWSCLAFTTSLRLLIATTRCPCAAACSSAV
ncbi:unnamed protein product, partial [Pylaiella littoralis]